MLQPTRTKFRKAHKGRIKGIATSGVELAFGHFGLKALVPPAPEDLYEIVNERYERGSLIITSNRAFAEWPDLFHSPLLASAALDRLAHNAHQLVITGDSYRARGSTRDPDRAA